MDDKGKKIDKVLDSDSEDEIPKLPIQIKDDEFSLSKCLTNQEVGVNPKFYIGSYEAYLLTGGNYFMLECPSSSHSQRLLVFDGIGGVYMLLLDYYFDTERGEGYCISEDWAKLVADHNLQEGDTVVLTRQNIEALELCYYYDVTFDRKEATEIDSGGYPYEVMCLSKTLSAFEVVNQDDESEAKLSVDAREAGLLLGCPDIAEKYPGTFSEDLTVLDEDGKSYGMVLSRLKLTDEEMIYTVDNGWCRFVKVHDLKAGDRVFIYRSLGDNTEKKPYYNVRYIKKNMPSGSGESGAGPSNDA